MSEKIQCPHCQGPIELTVVEGRSTVHAVAGKVEKPPEVDPPPDQNKGGSTILNHLRTKTVDQSGGE